MSDTNVSVLPSNLGRSRVEDLVLTARGEERLQMLNALLDAVIEPGGTILERSSRAFGDGNEGLPRTDGGER